MIIEPPSTHKKASPPPFDTSCSTLVWPHTVDMFMKEVWQQKPVFVQGNPQRLQHISNIIPFTDIHSILRLSGSDPIEVFFKNEQGFHEQFQCLSIDEAVGHYDEGKTLYFHIDQGSTAISAWMKSLLVGMGLGKVAVRASIFASKQSAGIAPHFDANENFTIQLRGAKAWEIAPNEYLDNPTSNYFAGEPMDNSMRAYVHHNLPTTMPTNCEIAHLQSGSMLYLPGGYWHTTNTTEQESISLNIMFPRVTWADVFLQSVRPILLQDSRWRARSDDLIGSMENRARARPTLEKLVVELSKQLGSFNRYFASVQEFARPLDAIAGTASLIRNPLVAWRVMQDDANEYLLEFHPPLDEPVSLRVPVLLKDMCEWIGSTHEAFTFNQLRRQFAEYDAVELQRDVSHLSSIGFVQQVP